MRETGGTAIALHVCMLAECTAAGTACGICGACAVGSVQPQMRTAARAAPAASIAAAQPPQPRTTSNSQGADGCAAAGSLLPCMSAVTRRVSARSSSASSWTAVHQRAPARARKRAFVCLCQHAFCTPLRARVHARACSSALRRAGGMRGQQLAAAARRHSSNSRAPQATPRAPAGRCRCLRRRR